MPTESKGTCPRWAELKEWVGRQIRQTDDLEQRLREGQRAGADYGAALIHGRAMRSVREAMQQMEQ